MLQKMTNNLINLSPWKKQNSPVLVSLLVVVGVMSAGVVPQGEYEAILRPMLNFESPL